jgi:hypothetical protein
MTESGMLTLVRYVGAAGGVPFEYGVADCLTFVAGAAIALGRPDPIAHIRGTYDTPLTAKRQTRALGGLAGVAASSATEIPAGEASAGDWALVRNWDGTESLGLVIGATIWAKSKHGVAACSRARAERFYRP